MKGVDMVYVGIDRSGESHSLCVLDEAGDKLREFEIPHGQVGFETAHDRIAKYASATQDALVAIETKDSLIVDFFPELGYSLHFLNPRQTDRHLFNALSPLDEHSKLREPHPTPAPSILEAYPAAVKSLLRQMHGVLEELQAVEEEIRVCYKDHPNKQLLESLPGIA